MIKWSLKELFEVMSWKFMPGGVFKRLLYLPITFLKQMKVFIHWLFKGYTKEYNWDLGFIILQELEFRVKGFIREYERNPNSYPATYEDKEEWLEELKKFHKLLNYTNTSHYYTQLPPTNFTIEKNENGNYKLNIVQTKEEQEEVKEIMRLQQKNDIELLEKLSQIIFDLWD